MCSIRACRHCGSGLLKTRPQEVVSLGEQGSIKTGLCDFDGQVFLFGGVSEYISECWYHYECWEASGRPEKFLSRRQES